MKRSGIFWTLMLFMGVSLGFFLRGHLYEQSAGLSAWSDGLSLYQASLPEGEWQWHSAATLLLALTILLSGWTLRLLSTRSRCLLAAAILWSIAAVSIGFLTYFPAERKVPVYQVESALQEPSSSQEVSVRHLSERRHTQLAYLGLVTFYAGGVLMVVHAWRSRNPALELIRVPAAALLALSFMLLFAYVMIPSPPGGLIQRSGLILALGFITLALCTWMRLSDYVFLRELEAQEGSSKKEAIGLKANDVLDGYRLLRPLGKGGFGEVWLCRCGVLRDFKALKFICQQDPVKLDKELAALRTYQRALGHWHGDHLIPIHHVGQNDQGLYYVMPLADGFGHDDPRDEAWTPYTLASLVQVQKTRDTWFDASYVVKVMLQILEALTSLNRAQLMHRDVKPDNVLFIRGKVCLADVSLVRSDTKSMLTRIGAVNYMAPEWYDGHPDMYGVAMTMYYFITGHSPELAGREKFQWPDGDRERVREPDQPIWTSFHHQVIHRATSDDAKERFKDFEDMAGTLRTLLEAHLEADPHRGRDGMVFGNMLMFSNVLGSAQRAHHMFKVKRREVLPRLKNLPKKLVDDTEVPKTSRRSFKKLVQISQRLKTRTRDKGRGE